jgi:uncharacterized protein (DUF433 family)
MTEKTLDSKRIYTELDMLKGEIRGLKQLVSEVVTRTRPTIQTEHPHIVRVEGIRGGEPIIKGTGTSVRTIVERTRLSDTPEQIVDDYPHLTLAQVYDALSYYHEHPQEIEQYIAENKAALCKTPKSASSSPSTLTKTSPTS